MPQSNEFDDEYLDEDGDEYGDADDDGIEPTVECPHCGSEMLEISHQCPICGEIPSREFRHTTSQPRWVVITAAACLGLLLWWLLV